MNQIIDLIKQNKKIVIIIGVVVALLLVLLVAGKGKTDTNGFFTTVSYLDKEEQYNGTLNLNVGGRSFTVDLLKNGKNYAVSANALNSEISLNDLIVKQDGVTYFNTTPYSANGGLIALRDATSTDKKKEKVSLSSVLISALSTANITTEIKDDEAVISVNSSEEWNSFFTAINSALSTNIDALAENYKEKEAAKAFINEFVKYSKQAAETNTIANTISASISRNVVDEVVKYTGYFEITADYTALPDCVDPEVFDSNQLKITGDFSITVGAASTAKPAGAVYDANAQTLSNYNTSLWNSIFTKEQYIALNEVTITSNSVTNKYNLGETIEESVFTFNNEGLVSATWTITTYNELIADLYNENYAPSEKVVFFEDQGLYQLTFSASDEGIAALNKLGSTPNKFGEYLKSAKGGEIIV